MRIEQYNSIYELDLSMIRLKLMDKEEGMGWSYQECETWEIEYKRFLVLNKKFPQERIIPTVEVDKFWHYHILDTRKYHLDCEKIFGTYLHHYPYLGMFGEEDANNLIVLFKRTNELYLETFKEALQDFELQLAHCAKCARCGRS